MLILSLEALKKPIVYVVIAEEDMSSACQAKTWLEMWKTVQSIGKAKNAGIVASAADFAAGSMDEDNGYIHDDSL